ncbi:MAG: hypothetical protein NTW86_31895 [Candidatus Sumerlaeota bacterium]|nr:hypothetical protein [Candidatus Sumerlaeota bacterium]
MDTPAQSKMRGAERAPKRTKASFSAGYYFLLVALGGAALLVLTDNVGAFAHYIYSPYSISILVVIGAMYLLQKGGDRSRMFRLELRAMRRRRLEDIQFFRKAERDLDSVAELLGGRGPGGSAPSAQDLPKAREALENLLDQIRNRE